jgi:hypothetical protein
MSDANMSAEALESAMQRVQGEIALAQKLRTAQHNGYRTIEEYENAHNWAARQERRWGV